MSDVKQPWTEGPWEAAKGRGQFGIEITSEQELGHSSFRQGSQDFVLSDPLRHVARRCRLEVVVIEPPLELFDRRSEPEVQMDGTPSPALLGDGR